MSSIELARRVFDIEIEGLVAVRDSIDEHFLKVMDMCLESLSKGGKLVITGVGKNLHIAEKMSATLASTGSTSVVLNPSQAIHGDLGILAQNDVLFALSYSGESEEIKNLIPAVRRLGVPVVAMTGNADSGLAKLSQELLLAKVPREACPFGMAPTSSTTATLALGDAFAMALLDARGFKKEDYAKLHPGGAIGRALLLRVKDIMRKDEKVAKVVCTATVKEVVVAMTKARGGAAYVVDETDKLVGIYTDGDFRRNVAAGNCDILNSQVAEVMTKNPTCVKPDMLAVDVLRVLEKRDIDDLPVVNEVGNLVGAIDIQDLPKVKVM